MFGEGIGVTDLFVLLNAVKSKDLVLEVKILDKSWEPLSSAILKEMIQTISSGKVGNGGDIRLRLHAKASGTE